MRQLDLNRRRLLGRALALGAVTALPACNYSDPAHPDLADRFLHAMSAWNDRVQAALFSRHTLAPTFAAAQITNPPRFNAFYDISQAPVMDEASYRLELGGQIQDRQGLELGGAAGAAAGGADYPVDLRGRLAGDRAMGRRAA